MSVARFLSVIFLILCFTYQISPAQGFIHPGIDQTEAELQYMKQQVQAGAEPWKGAFDRLLAKTPLDEKIAAHTHVIRGSYGKPNIGGGELSRSADRAYDFALLWYITEDRKYAEKAIELLRDWSAALRSFDYNDAKLLAGWTGHKLCNAAEILRYSNAGWTEQDRNAFSQMLMTVYYPLLRDYFPQANGNWDGAIIHSLLAIGVFTDNNAIFNDAINHFLYSPVNGSIFKYIYPSGQCQESVRDQGHVQLGLEEFAGAARIARTQGIDLFSLGNHRIALGFEYTAKFLLGENPHCYGIQSERKREEIRDIYEYVYQYHKSIGVDMPYSGRLADSIRSQGNRTVLTAFPLPAGETAKKSIELEAGRTAFPAGALPASTIKAAGYIVVEPGQSLQEAVDRASKSSGKVLAKAGVHTLHQTLEMPSNVTLAGEGLQTILILDPASGNRDAIKNANPDMHDVTISNLVVEGYTKTEYHTDPNSHRSFKNGYNRGGIIFLSAGDASLRNIKLHNLTVKNCTTNGVLISGGSNIEILGCNFDENGASVVPGPRQLHNLSLGYCSDILVKDSRLDTSPNGCGIKVLSCKEIRIDGCEIARNGWGGIVAAESSDLVIENNLIEANDAGGIVFEHFFKGIDKALIRNNQIQYNGAKGIAADQVEGLSTAGNALLSNRE